MVVFALTTALVIEALVTVLTSFIPSTGDYYGGPLPVGINCFDIPLGRVECQTTFNGLLFGVDVVISALVWFLLARTFGVVGAAASVVGALFSLLLIPIALSLELPIVGLPIPLGPSTPIPNYLVVWIDLILWAVAASVLAHALRRRLQPRPFAADQR